MEALPADENAPQQPLPAFLDRVSTPQKLRSYLDALSVSDVRRTGVDKGLEFNQTLSILLRMLVLGEPQHYKIDPALRNALLDRVFHQYRNPETAFWGERYRREGREDFQDDLSTTFHIVSYLKGQLSDMPRVIDTTLALQNLDYPVGWLWKQEFWNHNNMDVVTLFRYGWPTATSAQREQMRKAIRRMLTWCLTKSLQPDGSFAVNIADGSVEDAEYYGTAFLARIGYFNPALRFWTDETFPDSADVKRRIEAFVQKHQNSDSIGDHYKRVIEQLND